MNTHHRPLLVRAHLEAGIAHAGSWGIALDGLLAAQLWADHKRHLRAAGEPTASLVDTPNPADLQLPLARCTLGADQNPDTEDLWHWAATTSYPENKPDLPPDVRYWNNRIDHRAAEQLTPQLPSVISDRQGRYRARHMPLLTTICTSVTWTCVGDPTHIAELLTDITAIGKRRAAGEGHVLAWEIAELDHLDPWTAGHLHPDGTLGRPTPAECLAGHSHPTATVGTAGIRPPYVHRSRQHLLHLPANLDQLAT